MDSANILSSFPLCWQGLFVMISSYSLMQEFVYSIKALEDLAPAIS